MTTYDSLKLIFERVQTGCDSNHGGLEVLLEKNIYNI